MDKTEALKALIEAAKEYKKDRCYENLVKFNNAIHYAEKALEKEEKVRLSKEIECSKAMKAPDVLPTEYTRTSRCNHNWEELKGGDYIDYKCTKCGIEK